MADFLAISVASGIWPALVEAAGFEAMRRDGTTLMGSLAAIFQGGSSRFFHKGTNDRWRGVFRAEDLLLYEAKAAASLSPACRAWVANGRRADRSAQDRAAAAPISAS